jgi:hypothetical protein
MSVAGGLRHAFHIDFVKPLGLVGAAFDFCSVQPNRIDPGG